MSMSYSSRNPSTLEGTERVADDKKLIIFGKILDAKAAQTLLDKYKTHRSLDTLRFYACQLTSDALLHIGQFVTAKPTITTLEIESTPLAAAGVTQLAQALARNTSLTTLKLNKNEMKAAEIKALAPILTSTLPLQNLNLSNNDLSKDNDNFLRKLLSSRLPLTELDLSTCHLFVNSFQDMSDALADHKTLTSLDLSRNRFNRSAEIFKEIVSRNRSLRQLQIREEYGYSSDDSAPFKDEEYKMIAEGLVDNLQLEEMKTYHSNASITNFLERNKQLARLTKAQKSLKYNFASWGAAAFHHVTTFFDAGTALTELSLTHGVLDAKSAAYCAAFMKQQAQLTIVDLSDNPLQSEGVRHLSESLTAHPNLTYLALRDVQCDDEGVTALLPLITPGKKDAADADEDMGSSRFIPHLQTLLLGGNAISEKGFQEIVAALAHNTTLRGLSLARNPLKTATKPLQDLLSTNQGLMRLDVSGIKFDPTVLELKHSLPWIENIFLQKIWIDGKTFLHSHVENRNTQLTQLKPDKNALEFQGGFLGANAFSFITKAFTHNTALRYLTLAQCALYNDLVECATPFVTHYLATLLTIDVSDNRLDASSIKLLTDVFKKSKVLTDLNVSGNPFGDEGATHIAELLRSPTPLAVTSLHDTRMTATGLQTVIAPLGEHRTLFDLDFSGNTFSDESLNALARQLNLNKFITSLNLRGTSMTLLMLSAFVTKLDPDIKSANKKPKNNLIDIYIDENLCLVPKGVRNPKDKKETKEYKQLQAFLEKNRRHRLNVITAARDGNLSELRTHLPATSMYVCSEDTGDSLLHMTTRSRNADATEFLLGKGFNLHLLNNDSQTPQELAEELGDAKITKLFAKPADVKKPAAAAAAPLSRGAKRKPGSPKAAASASASAAAGAVAAESATKKPKKEDNAKLAAAAASGETLDDVAMAPAASAAAPASASTAAASLPNVFALVANRAVTAIEWRSEYKFMMDKRDHQGHTLLYSILTTLQSNTQEIDPFVKCRIDLAYALIRHGADPMIRINDPELKVDNTTALIRAVASNHYRLMKIFLLSPHCDPNQKDANGNSAIDWAVYRNNILMLERLLIDRRLTPDTVQKTLTQLEKRIADESEMTTTAPQLLQHMQSILKTWLQNPRFTKKPGVQWTSNLTVMFGSRSNRPGKTVVIDSKDKHARLMLENELNRNRLFNKPDAAAAAAEVKDTNGNPITASMIFIVSANPYQKGNNPERTHITVDLDFAPDGKYHLKLGNGKDEKDLSGKTDATPLIDRVKAVPTDAFEFLKAHRKPQPVSADDIADYYQKYLESGNKTFQQLLHHGEQSLLSHLEQKETIEKLLHHLANDKKFKPGCKVYGIALLISGMRYTCSNCEPAILGAQTPEHSLFLRSLCSELVLRGCVLPTYSPFKMLTLASSYQPYPTPEHAVTQANHINAIFDLRDCDNTTILAHDFQAFPPKATQYHSRGF